MVSYIKTIETPSFYDNAHLFDLSRLDLSLTYITSAPTPICFKWKRWGVNILPYLSLNLGANFSSCKKLDKYK